MSSLPKLNRRSDYTGQNPEWSTFPQLAGQHTTSFLALETNTGRQNQKPWETPDCRMAWLSHESQGNTHPKECWHGQSSALLVTATYFTKNTHTSYDAYDRPPHTYWFYNNYVSSSYTIYHIRIAAFNMRHGVSNQMTLLRRMCA